MKETSYNWLYTLMNEPEMSASAQRFMQLLKISGGAAEVIMICKSEHYTTIKGLPGPQIAALQTQSAFLQNLSTPEENQWILSSLAEQSEPVGILSHQILPPFHLQESGLIHCIPKDWKVVLKKTLHLQQFPLQGCFLILVWKQFPENIFNVEVLENWRLHIAEEKNKASSFHPDFPKEKFDQPFQPVFQEQLSVICEEWSRQLYTHIHFKEAEAIKQAEKQLQDSEERFRSFFENSQGLMCTHDLQGNLITVNKAGAQLLGYETIELIGKNLTFIVPEHLHPQIHEYLKRVFNKGKDRGLLRTQHRDGTNRIWLYNNTLVKNHDDTMYIIGNSIDVTEQYALEKELKHTQEMLNRTHQVARVGLWEVDLEKNTVDWSTITKQIHEVPADFQPTLDVGLSYYLEGRNRDIIQKAIDECYTKGTTFDLELQIKTFRGQLKWVRAIGIADLKDGVCKRMYGTFQDITEECKQREKMREAQELAENASKAKSEFLANMSHEIRTPLNGVIGFTDLVLKTELTPTQQQYLQIAHQSAHTLLSVISDILDFSKIESGKLELDYEKCDLFELASQAADMITYPVQKKGLELLLNLDPFLPRFVHADGVRLKQVLINLLGNAAKFTEKGEIEISIQWKPIHPLPEGTPVPPKGTGIFHFSIRDTGIGIDPTKVSKIFEAFGQEDVSTTKRFGGTGLGLSISNRLLELMNTKLELESTPGEGSNFHFSIQLEYEQGLEHRNYDLSELKHILVVDDNQNNRLILRKMLEWKGITVTEAKSGLEALQLFLQPEAEYDLIMMDYHMPVMDGLETIEKLKNYFQTHQHLPPTFVLYSSSDDPSLADSCSRLGVKQRLVKPIRMEELFKKLAKEAGRFQGEQESSSPTATDQNLASKRISEQKASIKQVQEQQVSGQQIQEQQLSEQQVQEQQAIDQSMIPKDDINEISSNQHSPIKPEKSAGTTQKTSRNPSEKIVLLLAEDNQVNSLLMQAMLKKINPNMEVVCAEDGKEAVDLAARHQPNLIFMDIQMPHMNGYEATRLIRKFMPNTPIVAVTAASVMGEKEKCMQAGMNDFLTKPVVSESLSYIIDQYLHQKNYLQDELPTVETVSNDQLLNERILWDIVDHNKARLLKFIPMIQKELTSIFQKIQSTSLASPPNQSVAELAHKMRGTALSAGMELLAAELWTIESNPIYRDPTQSIPVDQQQQLSSLLEESLVALLSLTRDKT